MAKITDDYRAFNDINLSNARSEGESYEDYRKRLKQNKGILKLYNTIGREQFIEMFPEGINYKMFDIPTEEEIKEDVKKFGEAK